MTPEVKERIAQVRRGEIPDGYRKTMLGIVPVSWNSQRVDELCTITSGSTPKRNNPEYFTGDILWVTSGELKSKYIFDTKEKITDSAARDSGLALYEPGTVVIAIYGLEAAGVRGTASIIARKSTISQACMAFTQFQNVDNEFFYYWYLNHGEMIGLRYAQGTKQQNLSVDIVGAFPVCFPEFQEQRKIANILSAQDKVLELKERLLTEKQRQKKYLMQQPLTGKRRLPGFSGDWKLTKAREVFQNVTDKNHNGNLEVLSSTQDRGIIPRSQTDIDIKYDSSALPSYKKVKKGNFIISLRSFQGGIEYSAYEGLVSPAYTVLENKMPIDAAYYKQYFKSARYIAQLQTAVYGIRDGKQISYDDFGFIEICYPAIQEQAAIGEVLSAADREIDLLRVSLEQEKRKKKALSQLLLTGIVRV